MKHLVALIALFISTSVLSKTSHLTQFDCPLDDWSQSQIISFKNSGFSYEKQNFNELAKTMLGCLAHPNPEIRDDITYMAYYTWLRKEQLSNESVAVLYRKLLSDIKNGVNEKLGVYLPFAVLVYSEVIRVDRVKPYLTDAQLDESVEVISRFLTSIQDYRGFEDNIGWRHQIAHTADVALQLVLNKRLTTDQHDLLLGAIFSQVSPKNHSYVFGESKRLALPVLYSWLSEKHDIEQWQVMLDKLIDPTPFENWQNMYKSELALHKRHNTRAFLMELHKVISLNDHARLNLLTDSVTKALKKVD